MIRTGYAAARSVVLNLIVLLLPVLTFISSAKVPTMTPLELLQNADLVISGEIQTIGKPWSYADEEKRPWTVRVVKTIKNSSNVVLHDVIKFHVFAQAPQDYPLLKAGELSVLFLKTGQDYQCLSYGRQGIWPKQSADWPYNTRHVVSFEQTLAAFDQITKVLLMNPISKGDPNLIDMLNSGNSLAAELAKELISQQPKDTFPNAERYIPASINTLHQEKFSEIILNTSESKSSTAGVISRSLPQSSSSVAQPPAEIERKRLMWLLVGGIFAILAVIGFISKRRAK